VISSDVSRQLVIVGCGMHCHSIVEFLTNQGNVEIIGCIEKTGVSNTAKHFKIPILGDDSYVPKLPKHYYFLVGVGSVKADKKRQVLFELCHQSGLTPFDCIHPTSMVSPSASLGKGVQILPGAIIQSAAVIGDNVLINSGAIIEHHCQLSNNVHIAPGACLSGNVNVGPGTFIGAGSTIIQGVHVGSNATIGAGSVVVRDVPDNAVVVGNPGRIVT
jgi:UDP-perosamine 4-acetyltransferase